MTRTPDPGMEIRAEIIKTTNDIAVLQRDKPRMSRDGATRASRWIATLQDRLAQLRELHESIQRGA